MDDPYAVDAPYYEIVHAGASEDDLGLWLSFAGRTAHPVLEIGTGAGRVALFLASHGHSVTALDPSPAMLAIARERAAVPGPEFVCGRAPDVALPAESFGFALIPADVFLYCADADEQFATLEAVARALRFDGTLAVDLPGPALWLDPSFNGQPLLVYEGHDSDGHPLEAWHLRDDDLALQQRRLQVRYETTAADGTVRRVTSEHLLRYVYRFEAELLLHLAGFSVDAVYGDYDLGELTTDSERMIVVARRAGG